MTNESAAQADKLAGKRKGHGYAGFAPAKRQHISRAQISALSHAAFGPRSTVRGGSGEGPPRGSSDRLICLF